MIKFSIVIPIYNAANTLENCVKSITKHNYPNLEVILVNDGSKDNSLEVCNKLIENNEKITLLNKKNEGVAKARNDGLHLCTGDYVYFVDPDDLVNDKLFFDTNLILEEEKYDIIVFGHQKSIKKNDKTFKKEIVPTHFKYKDESNKKKLLTNLYLSGAGFSAWDKLINIDFLRKEDLEFPFLKRGQDMAFCANVFQKSKSVYCIDKIYYYYLDFNTTSNNKIDEKIVENHEYIFKCLSNIFVDDIDEFYLNSFLQDIYLKWFFYVIPNNILNSTLTKKGKKEKIANFYNDDFFRSSLSNFDISNARSNKNKIALIILKLHSANIHIIFIKLLNLIQTKLSRYDKEEQ